MIRTRYRLRRRLTIVFATFGAVVGLVYGAFTLTVAYEVEDDFFERMLTEEATVAEREFRGRGVWPVPRREFMRVYADTRLLPTDIAPVLAAEPARREMAGTDGRYYHVRRLNAPQPAWLIAEVSGELVVRPVRGTLIRLIVIALVCLIAFAALLAIWMAKRTTAPLTRLTAIVEGLTPSALPRRIAQDFGDDEVGILARGLDGLTDRLRSFVAREQAFTRDASHELRTPLAVLRGTTERLLAAPTLGPAERTLVVQAAQMVGHLDQTVHTLLTLAREDAAPASDDVTPLRALVEEVVVEQAVLLDAKAVAVSTTVTAEAALPAPEAVVRILLANLIGNAFAHSHAGTVMIAGEGRWFRISNSSDGHPTDGAMLVAPFVKGEQSAGWGLGLSIVERLCERYQLMLEIDADAEHFVVQLSGRDARGPTAVAGADHFVA
jgi:signal transduction histidine kinase